MPVQCICRRCGATFSNRDPKTARFYCSWVCRYAEPPLTLEERFWPKLSKNGPIPEWHAEYSNCWDWTGSRQRRQNGQRSYGYLKTRGRPITFAHQLAWTLAGGSTIPPKWEIGHTCDRPQCCRNDGVGIYVVRGVTYERRGHLWLTTHAANMADCRDKERSGLLVHPESAQRGQDSAHAKLTDDAVRSIRERYAAGDIAQAVLAAEYGVNGSLISMIVNRKRWTHL